MTALDGELRETRHEVHRKKTSTVGRGRRECVGLRRNKYRPAWGIVKGKRHVAAKRLRFSLPCQDKINHPAAARVQPRPAAVVEDRGIIAAGFFERIAKDGQAIEGAFMVDRLRQLEGRPSVAVAPLWLYADG